MWQKNNLRDWYYLNLRCAFIEKVIVVTNINIQWKIWAGDYVKEGGQCGVLG